VQPSARVDAFTSIEASLRLDAVGSAGFRMSRSKMADLISSGAVKAGGCTSRMHFTHSLKAAWFNNP
jgi:RNA-binding protein YlmH